MVEGAGDASLSVRMSSTNCSRISALRKASAMRVSKYTNIYGSCANSPDETGDPGDLTANSSELLPDVPGKFSGEADMDCLAAQGGLTKKTY